MILDRLKKSFIKTKEIIKKEFEKIDVDEIFDDYLEHCDDYIDLYNFLYQLENEYYHLQDDTINDFLADAATIADSALLNDIYEEEEEIDDKDLKDKLIDYYMQIKHAENFEVTALILNDLYDDFYQPY